ncbi:hypothetical protein FHG64_01400 [Antarcticibacterium flavum]|uniref:Lipocalin-like domain-containing protein n=1 Tax=Antarcticibacterium flavum TaxID=2058175 RepID=A0A5B7X0H2_9FLAO|nr:MULTISPECIES: hypothetical protein [Antarcticibacterium]MCM4158902.1 hypothetical protein [Antarcticibacterium sp. W02-3]QCY68158.1 hypothetical protein FHG64_01400 [Antarcticibacterium flavum]
MKLLKALMLLLAVTVLFACSKDDDTPPDPPIEEATGIEGEWQLEEYDYSGSSTVSHEDFTYTSSYAAVAKNLNVKLTIKTDPNTWSTEGNYTLELTTTRDGETSTREIVVNDLANAGSFVLNEDQFHPENQNPGFPEPGEINPMDITSFTIEELTSSRMVLSFEETHTTTENGLQGETTVKGTQVYKRL